jgi:hypothetical protein
MQYYLFIDECGHHNLEKIDASFPCFGVCGILVSHKNYFDIQSRMEAIKSKFWGDKTVIFRSYNLRKNRKEFEIFIGQSKLKSELIECINSLVSESRFRIVCPVIHKEEHKARYGKNAWGVYETAITFMLQRCVYAMEKVSTPTIKKLNIILEERSPDQDEQIKKHIYNLMERGDLFVSADEYKRYINSIEFAGKYKNIAGLQLADLMAYPIVTHVQFPERENFAFRYVIPKLDHKNGVWGGYGVIRFPRK